MAISFPYYEVTGNGENGGVSVSFTEPEGDGVTWTQADTDALISAVVGVVSAVEGVDTTVAYHYTVAQTNVTPS